MEKPLQYLDRAVGAITRPRASGPRAAGEQPITGLLHEITELDETKVILIGRTLTQASAFNEVVRSQVAAMNVGERYEDITNGFNSIRDDAKGMVDQLDDGKLDLMERVVQCLDEGQPRRHRHPLQQDPRHLSRRLQGHQGPDRPRAHHPRGLSRFPRRAEAGRGDGARTARHRRPAQLDDKKTDLKAAADALTAFADGTPADRARLEMARDERLRDLQNEERRYQIAKDLSDNLTISYSTSEVVMARLMQTTNAKERVYQQSISFFSTNETVLTALSASFTGLFGLHESTETLNAMKEGM